jgi:hypothetical protein
MEPKGGVIIKKNIVNHLSRLPAFVDGEVKRDRKVLVRNRLEMHLVVKNTVFWDVEGTPPSSG